MRTALRPPPALIRASAQDGPRSDSLIPSGPPSDVDRPADRAAPARRGYPHPGAIHLPVGLSCSSSLRKHMPLCGAKRCQQMCLSHHAGDRNAPHIPLKPATAPKPATPAGGCKNDGRSPKDSAAATGASRSRVSWLGAWPTVRKRQPVWLLRKRNARLFPAAPSPNRGRLRASWFYLFKCIKKGMSRPDGRHFSAVIRCCALVGNG